MTPYLLGLLLGLWSRRLDPRRSGRCYKEIVKVRHASLIRSGEAVSLSRIFLHAAERMRTKTLWSGIYAFFIQVPRDTDCAWGALAGNSRLQRTNDPLNAVPCDALDYEQALIAIIPRDHRAPR